MGVKDTVSVDTFREGTLLSTGFPSWLGKPKGVPSKPPVISPAFLRLRGGYCVLFRQSRFNFRLCVLNRS